MFVFINKIKKKYKENLDYKGEEKLSKVTIFFLMILNIVVFNILLTGISFQTKFLNNPNSLFPNQCKDMFFYKNKNNLTIGDLNYYDYGVYNSKHITTDMYENELSNECSLLNNYISEVKKELSTKDMVEKISQLDTNIYNKQTEIKNFKLDYNTAVFENIASNTDKTTNQYDNPSKNNAIEQKNNLLKLENQLKNFIKNKETIVNNFKSNDKVKQLEIFIQNNSEKVKNEYNELIKYYEIKKGFIEVFFAIPLLIILFIMTKKYLRNDKYIQYIISKNLLVVVSLPVIWNMLKIAFDFSSVIYSMIPKVFLKKLIELFYYLHLSFLFYYILMFLAIAILGFIIIKFQKRVRKEKVISKLSFEQSLNTSVCFNCNKRVNYVYMNNCPYCGNTLKKECKKCKTHTLLNLDYCYNCGEDTKDLKEEN